MRRRVVLRAYHVESTQSTALQLFPPTYITLYIAQSSRLTHPKPNIPAPNIAKLLHPNHPLPSPALLLLQKRPNAKHRIGKYAPRQLARAVIAVVFDADDGVAVGP